MQDSRPSIVWITIDSLRYDHSSLSNYFRDTTPYLENTTTNGDFQSFPKAFSHGIWTQPSVGSILSGTYPSYHGLGFRGRNEVIPESIATVPELFQEAGYHTACISEMGNIGPATGLDRGFDWYQPPYVEGSNIRYVARNPRATLQHLIQHTIPNGRNIDEYLQLGFERLKDGMMPLLTRDILFRWIKQLNRNEPPFFLYTHINGPHAPSFPPYPFQEMFYDRSGLSTADGLQLSRETIGSLEGQRELIANDCDLSTDQWEALISLYDGEARQIDSILEDVINKLSTLKNTIVVITSDHGELFGENGAVTHRLVINKPVSHVPLLIGGLDRELETSNIVQHIDVMEALVEIAGGETDQFQGYNILSKNRPYAITQKGPSPRDADDFEPYHKYNPEFNESKFIDSKVTAFRNGNWIYKWSPDSESLYRTSDEETDVLSEYPEIAEDIRSFYKKWIGQYGECINTDTTSNVSDAIRAHLADLGYAEE